MQMSLSGVTPTTALRYISFFFLFLFIQSLHILSDVLPALLRDFSVISVDGKSSYWTSWTDQRLRDSPHFSSYFSLCSTHSN